MDASTLAIIGSILAAPVLALITFIFNRPKYVSEIYQNASQIENSALEAVEGAMQILRAELATTQNKVVDLTNQITALQEELAEFKGMWTNTEAENIRLRIQIYELSSTIRDYAMDEMTRDIQPAIIRKGD